MALSRGIRQLKIAYQCFRKVSYPSREAALAARGRIRRFGERRGSVHVFACTLCRGWHVGTKVGETRRGRHAANG